MSVGDNYRTCKKYLNRDVLIATTSGQVYHGTITKVDSDHVYLRVGSYEKRGDKGYTSAFFFPGSFIVTLALFDLLAISLLEI